MINSKQISEGFVKDPDLKIREELLSFHAMNPFCAQTSSSRSYMMSSHISQSLPIYGGAEKIIQSGLEKQFGENTFSKKIEGGDFKVIKVIPRYRGISATSVSTVVHVTIIGQNTETGEYDAIEIPYHHSTHSQFGFKYKWDIDVIKNLNPGDIIPSGTVLANSPAVKENNGYAFGANANLCLLALPETSEDGMIISESFSKRLVYDLYETRHVEFGADNFPLNVYGDNETYKPFPEIGELVNKNSVLMVLRNYDENLSHSLTSKKDVREYDPVFDKPIYVKGPGDIVETSIGDVMTSEIVDIKAYTCPKYKRDVLTGTIDIVEKYVSGLKTYYQDIVETNEEIVKEHYKRYHDNNIKYTNRFHRLVVEALAINNQETNKISYSYRNEQLDLYRLSFLIKNVVRAAVGNKCSDSYGSKGVIIEVRPDDKMPYTIDELGVKRVADVVMDPASVVSRMNVGRIYEQYFTAMTRKTQTMMRLAVNDERDINKLSDQQVDKAFDILMGLLKIIGTEQYNEYLIASKDKAKKREIVNECLNDEVYILYRVSSNKQAWEIILESKNTPYYPQTTPVYMNTDQGTITFKNKVRIAPVYTILLNKTADNYLAVSTGKVNHFNILVNNGGSTKNITPWNDNAVRAMGETEGRLYTAYGSRKLAAETKDRSGSLETHKHIYKNILNAKIPTNIDQVVNRNEQPYGDDVSIQLAHNIFNASGITIEYTPHEKGG